MFILAASDSFMDIVIKLFTNEYKLFFTGVQYTILIAILGTFFGLVLSFLVTVLRLLEKDSRDLFHTVVFKKIGNILGVIYVELFRGTPMMVQAMIFYYGLAGMGIRLNLIVAGVIIVTLNTTAYMSEVLRSGINSIDKGQMEAARSIGMTKWQGYTKVIFPQVIKNMVPAIGNELVINIKDTAVLSVIGVGELFYMGKSVAGTYYRTFESFAIVAVMYLIVVLITTRILNYIIHVMNKDTKVVINTTESHYEVV